MKLTGAEIMIECLKEQDVDIVFGFPGGAVLNIYDALYKAQDEITHVLTSHEQGASHAADGYARATGKVGVCIATSGPGATNLVTGLATAYMVGAHSCIYRTGCYFFTWWILSRSRYYQITMPITKHNYIVKDVNKLASVIREAFAIAKREDRGLCLLIYVKM